MSTQARAFRPRNSVHPTQVPDYDYQRVEWKRFRDKCIARAGNVCERCDATGILQVHHPEYVDGKLPWDYPIEFCEVIFNINNQ